MMTVPMDNSSAPSTGELVQRLFNKNNELEKGLRMAAKSKVPSDPNAWLQMRENYEAIVLEDHNFSEKHEIEYALWQLHYRRIEEFRAHISASGPAASSNGGGKGGVSRPDRIKKIRSVFKGFLSEASGFYHDLILKIRAKYGLPLGYISGSPENEINLTNDMKKSAEMKKGSLSCHRCLIYLGDLARYKGLYGESGDSVARDYAAASSYYLQAASIWPSSGNPHHQLAILASYSGDDLMAVYRYFRSLAVDSPFSTARDNLIIAFEKNRHSYSQLFGDAKVSTIKTAPVQVTGRGRGRGHAKVFAKETNRAEADPIKEKVSSVPEMYKAFCIQFVRLNGILFTRTSLETFGEIFSLIMADFKELLSSGPEEKLNFGSDAAENGLFILRLIAILIFTVHNSNRESEGQSYAEILQRSVLLQNAFFAAFEFLGHILKRCIQLQDMLSSYLLPAILVFIEWLACRPDIVAVTDVEEKQANARSFFWTECVAFLNKLISSGRISVYGDEEETCFIDMRRYDEGEAGNHFALWEDFELRGFLPLHPAHLILDFSRKLSFGSSKDKKARVDRILSAGRSLMNVVKVEKQGVFFDQKLKKFCVGVEPRRTEDDMLTVSAIDVTQSSGMMKQGILPTEKRTSAVPQPPKAQFFMEGEEEDEVIVFKPPVAEKHADVSLPKSVVLKVAVENSPTGDWAGYGGATFSPPLNDSQLQAAALATSIQPPTSSANIVPQPLPEVIDRNISNWLTEQHYIDGFKNLSIVGNGFVDSKASEIQENHKLPSYSHPFSHPISLNGGSMFSAGPVGVSEVMLPSRFDPVMPSGAITDGPAMLPSRFDSVMLSGVFTDGPGMLPYRVDPVMPSGAVTDGHTMMMKLPASSLTSSRKQPVSRPVGRHFGPPPGFSPIPPARQLNESAASMGLKIEQHPLADDYSWLDGYQYPPSIGIEADSFSNYKGHLHHQHVSSGANSSTSDVMSFPFPGKQVSNVQVSSENQRKWQDTQLLEHLKLYNEQQVQRRNQQSPGALPEPHQGQSLLSGRFFV